MSAVTSDYNFHEPMFCTSNAPNQARPLPNLNNHYHYIKPFIKFRITEPHCSYVWTTGDAEPHFVTGFCHIHFVREYTDLLIKRTTLPL